MPAVVFKILDWILFPIGEQSFPDSLQECLMEGIGHWEKYAFTSSFKHMTHVGSSVWHLGAGIPVYMYHSTYEKLHMSLAKEHLCKSEVK